MKTKPMAIAVLAALAATPASAGYTIVNCAGDYGPYVVGVNVNTGQVAITGGAFGRGTRNFAGVPWTDRSGRLWVKAGYGSGGSYITVMQSLNGSSVAWRYPNGVIGAEDACD
jgi:hypothetical protein